MENDEPVTAARRRTRGPEATARASALERLKALRQGGRRSENGAGYDIKMETPIFDTVSEDDYDKLVAQRRLEAQGFIVDDDGLGYGDEGEEEDWSQAGLPPSSDESDGGETNNKNRSKRKKTEKKEKGKSKVIKKVNSSLSAAAAALMGKQRISSMFTSTVFKNRDKNLDCENIVDDVIAEFAPDENDRERRRRVQLPVKIEGDVVNLTVNGGLGRGVMNDCDNVVKLGQNCSVDEREGMVMEAKEVEKGVDYDEKREILAEVKETAVVVKEETESERGRVLNAKISIEEKDPAFSAMADWQAVRSGGNGSVAGVTEEVKSGVVCDEQSEFELEADGSLPFYIIDAHEEIFGANMGTLYLFGKVKAGNTYHSCCMVVKNMQRCVYAIPNGSIFHTEDMIRLEKDVEESRISPAEFRKKLQDVAYELKNEIANQFLSLNVSSFSMTPVKRKYAFERQDIPVGENYALKINYSFKEPPLPADLKGETFSALLGTHCSALELFLVKRKVKGPSWLSVSKFSTCPASQRVSWCKFEITADSPKDIRVSSSSKNTIEIPPVVVTAINLKTIINEKQNVNEIVSASLICCHKAKIDTPMLASEWKKPGMLSHFTVVRKLDGGIFPMGFSKEVTERNTQAGSNVLGIESSERALLNRLMIALNKLDSDVLVGHNISGFDLDVLLHRSQACRVPSSMWSKIGRLKRSIMPKLTKGNTMFGSGASPGIMSCIAGRLLCDTYLCSRDLLKEVSYSLTELARTRLNKDRKEVTPHDIPRMFQSSKSLIELIEFGETDAWLSMELMFHLSVLPLTRQLTNISGNLWGKTLQGARAQRVEYLLLHAFHAKKYIVPDKNSFHLKKETKMTKRRIHNGVEEKNAEELDTDHANFDNDSPENDRGKGKKGPAYVGGLVLEPKKGLYDKYVLLLDFNSLYPSIIQEYNICFTTVEKSTDGLVPRLPSIKTTGVLPELLKNLVERRRMVKSWMKNASGLKVQQLDIQQQALKLTANSMYGCLGFSNSRFYAKPLAELITLQGREILQSTVDLVQNNLNLEVIYGDTDSIMIYSGLEDITKAKAIAGKVIQEVNKKYRCLEIDLDGLYKRMLLLKKKKYAAVKLQFKDGTPYEVIERKGLDMVRRDWSLLSKELGDFCLAQILSGGSCEDVVESIHNSLMKVQEEMRNGQVALEKYIITKTLTKPPEAYPDAKNQPHVMVALRLKQSGYTTGCSVGDTVPYIICCEQGATPGSSSGIAQRARHPDELKKDDGKWMIDIDYYLSQQIHPVVSRLCASIQGTSPERLADCLGLDSSKFQIKSSEAINNDPASSLLFAVNDEERYRSCEPLLLSCPSCSGTFECPAVFGSICTSISANPTKLQVEESVSNFWCRMRCPKCPEEGDTGRISPAMLANQVKRQAEGFVSMYYKGLMTCDDETCKHITRSLNLRLIGDSERGTVCPNYPRCNGRLVRKYTEAELYKQLSFYCYLLDTVRCMEKMDAGTRISLEKKITKIRPMVDLAVSTVQKIRDRCAYGWVQLSDLSVTV
ncbi:DNA polymerase alpha catalytic subunit [Ricinus communis]|uniref:DNA polymerase n=1 Tax=Ricinus communis TaxID=3988 RepID=B9SC90_RICCO|nr:DNA polymerase alpha catalytic subunit [Ricinus communis]EEF38804.1 DNA polymerase alpha catalytic subunit, putative [Ricinus communis]|eukprot:XP_002523609.1 DNA polymerase alpha catalytic subunit [Ricinus communis]